MKRVIFEEWRPTKGYPGYEVSSLGRVRSISRFEKEGKGRRRWLKGKVLKLCDMGNGYLTADLANKMVRINVLVATNFIGPKPTKAHIAHHKDRNRGNNPVHNIEWITQKENIQKAIECGKYNLRPNVKLTESEVIQIRKLNATGNYFQRELCDMFKVSMTAIQSIIYRKTWRNI